MPEQCAICGEPVAAGDTACPECGGLLRWVRGYFSHVPGLEGRITPETTFNDLGADSLDWMDWLVEAQEKLGIEIPEKDAEELRTVGQFVRYLHARSASWSSGDDLRLKQKGGCFRRYIWERVRTV